MFYFAIFSILFVFSVLEISNLNKTSHKILIGISWLMLVLVAGLRYETGGDWGIYTSIFEKTNPIIQVFAGKGFGNRGMESGFLFLCSLIKQFGGSIQSVYFLIVLFNITLITLSLKKYTKYILVGLFVYYCTMYFVLDMLYTRQSVAVAIVFYAMSYVKEKRMLRFFVLIAIATLFHRMAIVMIPLYFVLNYRFRTITLLAIVSVGCVLMFFNIQWIKNVFVGISTLLGENFSRRALMYVSHDRFAVARIIGIGFFLNIILFATTLFYRKKIETFKMGNIFINLFFVSLLVYYYMYELVEVSNRFRIMFFISLIVLFPYFVEIFEKVINKIVVFLGITAYSFMFNMPIFLEKESASAYNPYQNYWYYKLTGKKSTGKERLEKTHKSFTDERQKMKDEREKNK